MLDLAEPEFRVPGPERGRILARLVTHGAGPGAQALYYPPGSLLGTWWGLTIFKRLSDRQFAMSLNLLLILSDIMLAL
jgi:hypothetical protein